MTVLHVLIALLLFSLAWQVPNVTAEANEGMTDSKINNAYDAALTDYRASKAKEAMQTLKGILQREPRHREASMLLATIYYESQNLKKALQYFDRGDVALLTLDNAFAWGAIHLEFGDNKRAIAGFRYLLKNKGPFRPFAIYYLGVAYYNNSQWSRARKYLQKVKPEDLPISLRVNRRHYLNDIKQQQNKMLEAIIGNNNNRRQEMNTPQPMEDVAVSSDRDFNLDEDSDSARPDSKVPSQQSWGANIKPAIALAQQSSYFDNHGLTHDSINVFAHNESLSGNVKIDDQRKAGLGFLSGVEYKLGVNGYTAALDQTQYFALDQTTGIFASQVSRKQLENSGFIVFQPYLNWYLNNSWRWDLNLAVRSFLPEFSSQEIWGQTSQQVGLRYEANELELGLELEFQQPFDQAQRLTSQDQAARAEIERQFGDLRVNLQTYAWQTDLPRFITKDQFRLVLADPQLHYRIGNRNEIGGSGSLLYNLNETSLQFRYELFRRKFDSDLQLNRRSSIESLESVISGADKSILTLVLPLWDSASITGTVAYQILENYHFIDRNTDGTISQVYLTDVEQTIFQGGGMIAFANWIRLKGNYSVSSNNFLDPSAKDKSFKRLNPDYVVDSTLYLEVSNSF